MIEIDRGGHRKRVHREKKHEKFSDLIWRNHEPAAHGNLYVQIPFP